MGSSSSVVYNKPIQGMKEKGFSHIYRNADHMQKVYETPEPQFKSLRDVLVENCLTKYPNHDFLGQVYLKINKVGDEEQEERTMKKFKYREVFHMAENVGSYIINNQMDFPGVQFDMKLVGIFAKNRFEWMISDIACCLYGLTLVPLYDTLGIENLSFCLNNSGITTCFCSDATVPVLLKLKDHGNLKNIICFDRLSKQVEIQVKDMKFNLFYFEQALQKPQSVVDYKKYHVHQETMFTFSYTSGTTGPPKGAMLSHGNFLAFLAAFTLHESKGFKDSDVYLSFLPLPHVMERAVCASIYYSGAFVAFYSGDILRMKGDAAFVRPTIFVAVPRIFNRIVDAVKAKFEQKTGIAKCLIDGGVDSKLSSLRSNGNYTSGFYDKLVFSQVQEGFGGRIRFMITGSAPIKNQTYELMKVFLCCPFYEGYGQTENTAYGFIQNTKNPLPGQVGAIAASLEFKLMDLPQMHYTSDDVNDEGKPTPRGQIWMRGPAVFKGYYKNKEKTMEALTEDGWLRTGDVGMLLPGSNAMKIIDRKKNIFKLQQGEYVASEKVEAIYSQCHLVSQVFLHGQSHHNFAIAIISPNKEEFMKLAAKHNVNSSYEQICMNKQMKTLFCKELDSVGKKNGLHSFEQAKNVYLEPEPFLNKGILTNTMKLQRFAAKKLYEKDIARMYDEGPLQIK